MTDFYIDTQRQQLQTHIRNLRQLGYRPRDCSDDFQPLRDLICHRTGTVIECKTEQQQPLNYAIELASNLPSLPAFESAGSIVYAFDEAEYSKAKDFLRELWQQQPQKLSLGLARNLAPAHLLSHLFLPSNIHSLYSIRDVQRFVINELNTQKPSCNLAIAQTCNAGSSWWAISMLIPFRRLAAITATTAATAA